MIMQTLLKGSHLSFLKSQLSRLPQALKNLLVKLPLPRKVRLVLANNRIKILRLQLCCGNHGQPGC